MVRSFAISCLVGTAAAAAGSAGSAGADGWTPWYSGDAKTGLGDIEDYQSLDEKHNLCGRSVTGGFAKATAVECQTTKGVPAAQTGQNIACTVNGFSCLNADNQKCSGADAKCAAANTAAGVNRHGISNQEDQCKEHAVAHGCHWGCCSFTIMYHCGRLRSICRRVFGLCNLLQPELLRSSFLLELCLGLTTCFDFGSLCSTGT